MGRPRALSHHATLLSARSSSPLSEPSLKELHTRRAPLGLSQHVSTRRNIPKQLPKMHCSCCYQRCHAGRVEVLRCIAEVNNKLHNAIGTCSCTSRSRVTAKIPLSPQPDHPNFRAQKLHAQSLAAGLIMSFPTPGGAALIAIALWHADLFSGLTAVVSQHNVDSVALFLAGMRHARQTCPNTGPPITACSRTMHEQLLAQAIRTNRRPESMTKLARTSSSNQHYPNAPALAEESFCNLLPFFRVLLRGIQRTWHAYIDTP